MIQTTPDPRVYHGVDCLSVCDANGKTTQIGEVSGISQYYLRSFRSWSSCWIMLNLQKKSSTKLQISVAPTKNRLLSTTGWHLVPWFHGLTVGIPGTLGIRIQLPYVLDAFFPWDRGPRTVTVFRRGHSKGTGGASNLNQMVRWIFEGFPLSQMLHVGYIYLHLP